jgi:hypothetical protein
MSLELERLIRDLGASLVPNPVGLSVEPDRYVRGRVSSHLRCTRYTSNSTSTEGRAHTRHAELAHWHGPSDASIKQRQSLAVVAYASNSKRAMSQQAARAAGTYEGRQAAPGMYALENPDLARYQVAKSLLQARPRLTRSQTTPRPIPPRPETLTQGVCSPAVGLLSPC